MDILLTKDADTWKYEMQKASASKFRFVRPSKQICRRRDFQYIDTCMSKVYSSLPRGNSVEGELFKNVWKEIVKVM